MLWWVNEEREDDIPHVHEVVQFNMRKNTWLELTMTTDAHLTIEITFFKYLNQR